MAFQLSSPDFLNGQPIPRKFSCDGLDVSPRLSWENAPSGTASFTLIMHDPDAPAGDWVHWVLYNIPSKLTELSEGIPAEKTFPNGMMQGRNSWHQVRYGGPCPPGGIHHYFFELFALDSLLKLEAGLERRDVMAAMQNHILAKAELMGTYTRNK